MKPRWISGPDYLRLATRLLQRMRLAAPEGGIWEAADIQWWSRLDQRTGLFWLDEDGEPLAAFLATGFRGNVQCDVLLLPEDASFAADVWQIAIAQAGLAQAGLAASAVGGTARPVEVTVRLDDETGIAALTSAGYPQTDPASVVACWPRAVAGG
jgi:hypothetical protein